MIAPATMPWTIGIQFINQTWNALFNWGNASKKSPQTNADIGKSYVAALVASISISVGVR
jgi:hypothetical protein